MNSLSVCTEGSGQWCRRDVIPCPLCMFTGAYSPLQHTHTHTPKNSLIPHWGQQQGGTEQPTAPHPAISPSPGSTGLSYFNSFVFWSEAGNSWTAGKEGAPRWAALSLSLGCVQQRFSSCFRCSQNTRATGNNQSPYTFFMQGQDPV